MREVYVGQGNPPLEKKIFVGGVQRLPADIDGDVSYRITNEAGEIVSVSGGEPLGSGFVAALEPIEVPMTDPRYGAWRMPLPSFTKTGDYTLEIQYTLLMPDSASQQVAERDIIVVSRPYVSYEEIIGAYPSIVPVTDPNADAPTNLDDRTYKEVADMERTVRYIINTFCGQSFDLHSGITVYIRGVQGNFLQLPLRLVDLTSISTGPYPMFGQVTGNEGDWVIRYDGPYGPYPYRDIKRDIGPGMGLVSPTPFFKEGLLYQVTGNFGWREVPPMINQAARMLIWDYFKPESEWRRRNIDVMRAADWRVEFASQPISTTGNVDVDLMLSNYVAPNMVIL